MYNLYDYIFGFTVTQLKFFFLLLFSLLNNILITERKNVINLSMCVCVFNCINVLICTAHRLLDGVCIILKRQKFHNFVETCFIHTDKILLTVQTLTQYRTHFNT